MCRFSNACESDANIAWITKYWNRRELKLIRQPNMETEEVVEKGQKKTKGPKKSQEELDQEEERNREILENELAKEEVGLEQWSRSTEEGIPEPTEYLPFLPDIDEVLEGLGQGKNGPPIPSPVEFSVVPYPDTRDPPKLKQAEFQYFSLIATSPNDPNIHDEDKLNDEASEIATTPMESEKDPPGSAKTKKRRGKGSGRKSTKEKAESTSPELKEGDEEGEKILRLGKYRWVLDPGGEATLRVRFVSDKLGQIDEILSFEVTGNRKRYQIFCRGTCAFPTIVKEPKQVFTKPKNRKQSLDATMIAASRFEKGTFHFEPLLVGKTRDKNYPENMLKLNIINSGTLDAEVSFAMRRDPNQTNFTLDVPTMTLTSNTRKVLTVTAYPRQAGVVTDDIICCIKDNPEPVVFNIQCQGVKPEIQLDRKIINFEKVLLHRQTRQSLQLFNPTDLPVAWRVDGFENLGDEFTCNQESGIIAPQSTFSYHLDFRALKAVNVKRNIRIITSDIDNITGDEKPEIVQVLGEAYDVALDMSFPKGADGGLDFGTIRVFEETKQACTLKNKGKYEISFKFTIENHFQSTNKEPLSRFFKIMPQQGSLLPQDRPTQIQVQFNPIAEFNMTDMPVLKCHVIEPNMSDTGETIASIPLKITARSVFAKFTINPTDDINFGAVHLGSCKRTFSVENNGEFDFKFTISKLIRPSSPTKADKKKKYLSRDGSAASRKPTITREQTQTLKIMHGPFAIYPGFGNVPAGGATVITVDCTVDQPKKFEEFLAIDIADRNTAKNPGGIPYKLLVEGCVPTIDTNNIHAIFEEHRVVSFGSLIVYLFAALPHYH